MPDEFRLTIVLIAIMTLPGWAVLAVSRTWRRWDVLQRWCLAVGLSIALYPVLFYGLRFVEPTFTLGPYKMAAFLVGCLIVTVWRLRGHLREQLKFDRLEWIAIGVFGVTVFTRYWVIRDHPYPAWSDSLHHVLLTQLTAVQGQLPVSMAPDFPIPLGLYHLGLYSLSASAQWLAQVPAHTSLLWTAQALNGLCGLGVYLVLDRTAGRMGAIVGALAVGLLSHQPAFYVNWGRFTQVSAQAVLLIAWVVSWQAIASWKRSWSEHRAEILWNTSMAAVLTASVFLLHFRVAVFYLPLLGISVAWELHRAQRDRQAGRIALGTLVVGIGALILTTPALWEALRLYIASSLSSSALLSASEAARGRQIYHEFPWSGVPYLVAHSWLLVLAVFSAMFTLARRNRLVVGVLLWMAVLLLIGNAHRLGSSILEVTNLGAVLIMLYVPIGLIIGAAAEELLVWIGTQRREQMLRIMVTAVFVAGFVFSHARVTDVEAYRYFVTPADLSAMNWIKANTPPDAHFAINTTFWLPDAPHGTDGGYWIPYFTGRQTTASTMLFSLGSHDYAKRVIEMSQAVERLEVDTAALSDLRAWGAEYVYIGAQGDFSGPGLNAERLSQAGGVHMVYQQDGVSILRIEP